MFSKFKAAGLGALLVLSIACFGPRGRNQATPGPPPPQQPVPAQDIADTLRSMAGVTGLEELNSPKASMRLFQACIDQPVDHAQPEGARFKQRFTLVYRSRKAPVVVVPWPVDLPSSDYQAEPTRLLEANQLVVEQRFAGRSVPEPADWTRLDLRQTVTDCHRAIQAFKPVFQGPWLSTGDGAPGRLALYHRRLFPQDVTATLVYGAPLHRELVDPRISAFVDSRAGAQGIRAWQEAFVSQWPAMLALFEAEAAKAGHTFSVLGASKALQVCLVRAPMTLWRLHGPALARTAPKPGAAPEDLYGFLARIYEPLRGPAKQHCDKQLERFRAHYHLAAVQSGYTGAREDLPGLPHAGLNHPGTFLPGGVPGPFDPAPMGDLQDWIGQRAEKVILVAGENDPWAAWCLELPPASVARNVLPMRVPGGNADSELTTLPLPERVRALGRLRDWLGLPHPPADPSGRDIGVALKATPGVGSVTEYRGPQPGDRLFAGSFRQPVDHDVPMGPGFDQTFTLLYRSWRAPMVLHLVGYDSPLSNHEFELTTLLDANQLVVEHRFFGKSKPDPVDWTKLDIRQASHDCHALVQALKPHFQGAWISSGESKGGGAAVYHRRFHPGDVAATCAFRTPHLLEAYDPRFIPFLESRGGPGFHDRLRAWQQGVVDHWPAVLGLLRADYAAHGVPHTPVSLEKDLQYFVEVGPFLFWQYYGLDQAGKIPPAGAPPADLYACLRFTQQGDKDAPPIPPRLAPDTWQPYHHQAAIQLGRPAQREDLPGLPYPGMHQAWGYLPFVTPRTFDPAPMRDIRDWVHGSAERMLFLYGEDDPWTAAAFDLPPEALARDNHLFTVPKGNHFAPLRDLPQPGYGKAMERLCHWLDLPNPYRIEED